METRTGKHIVRIEGDVVFVRRAGVTDLKDARAMCEAMARVLDQHGRGFWLFDLSEAGAFQHEARVWVGEWEKNHRVTALASFGGSLEIRSMTRLVASAIRSYPGREAFKASFHDTEADARAWIDAERRALIAPPA